MSARGKFITVEGIDGAGKSSHVDFLCAAVRAKGFEARATFEPGGTAFGQKMREVVLHQPAGAAAQALAMFSARSAHIEEVIEPALASGTWVVCDRFTDSTYAYQCGGHGLAPAFVAALESLVHPGLQPDVTFVFDVDSEVALARQQARMRSPDKFESQGREFARRVRDAFLERARAHPERIHVIDASGSLEAVQARVGELFRKLFP